jgi:hypothetical protein
MARVGVVTFQELGSCCHISCTTVPWVTSRMDSGGIMA